MLLLVRLTGLSVDLVDVPARALRTYGAELDLAFIDSKLRGRGHGVWSQVCCF
jgi:hypothetical protein